MAERRNRRNSRSTENYSAENGNGRQNPYNQGYPNRPYNDPYGQNPYRQNPYQDQYRQDLYRGGNQGGYDPNYYQQDPYRQGRPGDYYPPESDRNNKRKKRKKRKRILFVVEVLVLLILAVALFAFFKLSKINKQDINQDNLIINEQISPEETKILKGYTNIALFGVDSREGKMDIDAHSDAIMIASINNKNKDVKLVSVYRDTYLDNTNGEYRKATECYYFGGPQRAINMLNKNLDLNIKDFMTIDFSGLADVIELMGGIEIDVQENEIQWINGYQEEGSQVTGREIVPVTYAGPQILNGLQAMSYCRIRYTEGSDYKRTERQRTVLQKILEKAKTMDLLTLNAMIDKMAPNILTSLSNTEILGLAKSIPSYNLIETKGFPSNLQAAYISAGDCVVPVNLAQNVIELHNWLFGSDGYTPSDTVQEISNSIINETGIQ